MRSSASPCAPHHDGNPTRREEKKAFQFHKK